MIYSNILSSLSFQPTYLLFQASGINTSPLIYLHLISHTQEVLIIVAALSQMSIGATITWQDVLRSQLTTENYNFFNTKMYLSRSQMDLASEPCDPYFTEVADEILKK